jgi:hypothetical protein
MSATERSQPASEDDEGRGPASGTSTDLHDGSQPGKTTGAEQAAKNRDNDPPA